MQGRWIFEGFVILAICPMAFKRRRKKYRRITRFLIAQRDTYVVTHFVFKIVCIPSMYTVTTPHVMHVSSCHYPSLVVSF